MEGDQQHISTNDTIPGSIDLGSRIVFAESAHKRDLGQDLARNGFSNGNTERNSYASIADSQGIYFERSGHMSSYAAGDSRALRDVVTERDYLSSDDEDHGPRTPIDLQALETYPPRLSQAPQDPNEYSWLRVHERYAIDTEANLGSRSPTHIHGTRAPAPDVFPEEFYEIFPWACGIDPFDETQTVWRPAEWYLENRNRISAEPLDETAEIPPAIAFVKGLVSLELDDLDEEDQSCPVCMQKYREGEEDEMPLEFPCGHAVGKDCLLTWLTAAAEEGAFAHGGSCPQCRTRYVREKRQRLDTDEGLRQLLGDANYLLTAAGPLRLTTEGREQWEGVKDYVNGHLAEGKERVRQVRERFMMIMKLEVFRNPIFESVAATPKDLDALRGQIIAELEDLERRRIIAEYLEVDTDDAEVELETRIAEHLAAAPEVLQLVMHDVRDGRFDSTDFDGEFGDTENEVELPYHPGNDRQFDLELVVDYVARTRQNAQYYNAGRTYVIQPSQPIVESWGGDDFLWCATCDTIHREGSNHWGNEIRNDEAAMQNTSLSAPGRKETDL